SVSPSPSPSASPSSSPSETPSPSPSATPSEPPEQSPEPKTVVVEIRNFAYSPETVEINVGDSVRFINRDRVGHTATADDGSFDTGLLGRDEDAVITFDEAGEFPYYCIPHPNMRGT